MKAKDIVQLPNGEKGRIYRIDHRKGGELWALVYPEGRKPRVSIELSKLKPVSQEK